MANLPISGLTASASNLAATDVTPVVQTTGVGPVKMTGLQIAGGLLGSTALTGATITTSQPVLNLSQTWNASGVTFTGLRFNATDTLSASGSLLLDIGTGGGTYVSKFSVAKTGTIAVNGPSFGSVGINLGVNNSTYSYIAGAQSGGAGKGLYIFATSANISTSSYDYVLATTGFFIKPTLSIGWASTSDANQTVDLFLTRAAAATLQLGAADAAAPVAQTLQVQSVVAGTTNTAGTNFTINGSKGTGTGAGGSIIFQVALAGSSGSSQNAYSTALTIASDRTTTITHPVGANYVTIFNNSGIDLYTQTNQRVGSINHVSINSQNWLNLYGVNGVTIFGQLSIGNGNAFIWGDAANTLALRNGTSAQRFNVYNTYTSSTNYETFKIDWITTANTCLIGTEKGSGGGTARDLALQTDGTTRLTIAAAGTSTFAGNVVFGSGADSIKQGNGFWGSHGSGLWIAASGYMSFGGGGSAPILRCDESAANIIAQRDGNNGQIFRVYGRYTSATNFERWFVEAPTTSAATVLIGTQKGSGGGSARALAFQTDGTTRLTIETNGDLTIADAENIIVGSTTGTKIGTATSQKIGFWDATPIVQPTTGVAAATVAATGVGDVVAASTTFDGYTIPQIVKAMRNAGLLA